MNDVAKAFNMRGFNISDHPDDIKKHLDGVFEGPMLLNINTTRKYWHAGAGKDGDNFDRYEEEMSFLGEEAGKIDQENKLFIEKIWQKQLEKL